MLIAGMHSLILPHENLVEFDFFTYGKSKLLCGHSAYALIILKQYNPALLLH